MAAVAQVQKQYTLEQTAKLFDEVKSLSPQQQAQIARLIYSNPEDPLELVANHLSAVKVCGNEVAAPAVEIDLFKGLVGGIGLKRLDAPAFDMGTTTAALANGAASVQQITDASQPMHESGIRMV